MLTYIDLFAGAGGLSEGFIRSGFLPIAHVEQDPSACLTLKTRMAYHHLKKSGNFATYVAYLKGEISCDALYSVAPKALRDSVINAKIAGRNLESIFTRIDALRHNRRIDVIIGGPPCQAYSLIGRVADSKKMKWDSRKFLYKFYAEFLDKYKPKMFVFENVPGLYTAGEGKYYRQMMELFDSIGYETEDKILDAADFGVIQHRRRVILVGWQKKLHISYPDFKKIENRWTIKDLFADLPPLKAGEVKDRAPYAGSPSDYLSLFEIRNGIDFVTQNITRPHNEKDLAIYKLVIKKWKEENKNLKNDCIPAKIRTQKNITSFLDRFKVVRDDTLSHTMIAHIAKDGHHFIHPDESQMRSISVREAARIQSFPDDYKFEGSRAAVFRQIGNAVPPLVADAIARGLLQLLKNNAPL